MIVLRVSSQQQQCRHLLLWSVNVKKAEALELNGRLFIGAFYIVHSILVRCEALKKL